MIIKESFLIAEGLEVKCQNLHPLQPFVLKIETQDDMGRIWQTERNLQTDATGKYEIKESNEDLMGILTMTESENPNPYFFYKADSEPVNLTISLSDENGTIEKKTIRMLFYQTDTEVESINDPFFGKFFKCPINDPKGSVIVLGGSSGGLFWSEQAAAFLSSIGYNTLAVNYFDRGNSDLPDELVEIELESLSNAHNWLIEEKEINPKNIHLMGISKGAEMAMSYAALSDFSFRSIVAFVPSSHVFEGISFKGIKNKSSWRYTGKAVSFLRYPPEVSFSMMSNPEDIRKAHDLALEQADPETLERARIKAENIQSPVLIISGSKDCTWNSQRMGDFLIKQIKQTNPDTLSKHINFERMGHTFFLPHFPPIVDNPSVRVEEALDANKRAWKEIIRFL
ncbi:MAG: alpha/beta hydrolase family protein [Thermotogota bacterium]